MAAPGRIAAMSYIAYVRYSEIKPPSGFILASGLKLGSEMFSWQHLFRSVNYAVLLGLGMDRQESDIPAIQMITPYQAA
jgi:hypothetical protein